MKKNIVLFIAMLACASSFAQWTGTATKTAVTVDANGNVVAPASFVSKYDKANNSVQSNNGTATNLTVHGITFDGAVTGLVTEIILQGQTDSQRQAFSGVTNQLVRNETDENFPLTVFDGSTLGGLQIPSWKGSIASTKLVYTTNTVDFTGWTTTGVLTNGSLILQNGDYLVSPLLSDGVASHSDSIYAPGNGSTWEVTVYTNSVSTPVDLPYYGSNARLRVDYALTLPLIGSMYAGVAVPATNGIIVVGFEKPGVLESGRYAPMFSYASEPVAPEQAARYSTVKTWYTNATTYSDSKLSAYQVDETKRLRGVELFTSGSWNILSAESSSNRTWSVNAGGMNAIEYTVPLGAIEINTFTIDMNDSTIAHFGVATNGVTSEPFVEYTESLSLFEWHAPSVISNSYPTAIGSNYVVTISFPDGGKGYFRALQKTGNSTCDIGADVFRLTNLPTATNGLPSGALWSDSGTLKVVP